MNSSSAYHPHHHHLPPPFIDHHQPQLSDLLLGLPHVPSAGSQQAPFSTLISRNGPPSSCLLNGRLPVRKDRHRKILTAQGLRDRRVRLSIGIARRFFDLQDMLGFDKASKTLEWLLRKSTDSINKLAMTKRMDTSHDKPRSSSPSIDSSDSGSSCNSSSFASLGCEAVVRKGKQKKAKLVSSVSGEKMKEIADDCVLERDQSRVRARARARERTRGKLINNCPIMALSAQVEGDARNLLALQIHNDNAAMKHRALPSYEFGITKQSMVTGRKAGSTSGRYHEKLATASSKDGNNFNNLESFFPSLHPQPQWDINGAINLNLSTRGPRSMDDLEKLIAPSLLKRTNGTHEP